ncbi:bacteriohemerythrin [bacterium]|nr:bacteriohemerythrin [bacterium]MCP5462217.1 bacteriohemerythrin [bacterium]
MKKIWDKLSLKTKVIFLLLGTTIITSIGAGYYQSYGIKKTIEQADAKFDALLVESINSKMEQQLYIASTVLSTVTENTAIQKLFAEKKRDELKELLLPVYEKNKELFDQFQFHLPDSTSFLRLHQPEKFGDSLKEFRYTVNTANKENKIVMGLEQGKGGYGYRVVAPMHYQGNHIGSVEVGANFGELFLASIKKELGGDYFIYLLEDAKNVAWNKKDTNTFIAGTQAQDTFTVVPKVLGKLKPDTPVFTFSPDGKWSIALIPFTDYQGEFKGYIKSVRDRKASMQELARLQIGLAASNIVVTALLLLMIIVIIKVVLRRLENLVTIVRASAHQNDLSKRFPVETYDELGKVSIGLNELFEKMEKTIVLLKESSDSVTLASKEIASVSQTLSDGAQHHSASFEEISSSIQINAVNTREANELAQKTAATAQESGIAMEKTITTMNSIEKSSKHISEAIGIITDIAEQTNLLALNAAIEAAHAGEHGKGFAVVADEVRKLAERSATAANKIDQIMKESITQVGEGVSLTRITGENLSKITQYIAGIAEQLQSVSDTTNEQASTMESNTTITEGNAAASEQLAASAENLATQAQTLQEQIAQFRVRKEMQSQQIISWDPSYDVSHDDMNDQHKVLFRLINDLAIARKKKDRNEMLVVVRELINYTEYHFGDEEKLMKKHKFPEYEAHKKIHKGFVDKIKQVETDIKENKKDVDDSLIQFLNDWLVKHIKGQDVKYGKHIH